MLLKVELYISRLGKHLAFKTKITISSLNVVGSIILRLPAMDGKAGP